MLPEDRHDFGTLAPFGPRKRRGPRFIVGKVRRGAACEEKLHHLHSVRAGRRGERRRSIFVVARRDVRAGVEKNGRALDGVSRFTSAPASGRHALPSRVPRR